MIVPSIPAETEDVALHYNELDEFYRDVWGVHVHALLDRNTSNRVFVVTLLRILVAYHTGAMQYGAFQISKPDKVAFADSGTIATDISQPLQQRAS